MSSDSRTVAELFTTTAPAQIQTATARLAQDVFGEIFRKAYDPDPAELSKAVTALQARCIKWCEEGDRSEAQLMRLALLITGLDQWGLAYTQTFNLTAIPPLTALISSLRTGLNEQSDALFQQFFELIAQGENNAVDFKIELRRSIHLALWHAMAACETTEDAQSILQPLGSMLLVLIQTMPQLGWRLVADTLAHIQIKLLDENSEVARNSTQTLFESLRHALPLELYQNILRLSSQAMLAWQQAQRSTTLQ